MVRAAATPRPAVFLDKDGTLVEDLPFNTDPALLRFTPRALPGLQRIAAAGFALVLVTNQSGLASGRITRTQYAALRCELERRLRDEAGVALAGWYTCPHAPRPDGRPACLCRKPAPGLLRQAALALKLDLAASWMVGDILDDIEAGRRAGCRTALLDVGNETVWRLSPLRVPQYRCADLAEVAGLVVGATALPPLLEVSG